MNRSESRRQLHEKYLSLLPNSSFKRKLTDRLVTIAAIACIVIVLIPLGSILLEVVKRGAPALFVTVTEFAVTLEGSTSATGVGNLRYDDLTHELSYSIDFSGLSSSETTTQIYGAATAEAEPSALFTLPGGSPKEGFVDLDKELDFTDAEKELFAGSWSLIISSENNPDGEITGQIVQNGKSSTYFNWRFLTDVPKSFNDEINGGLGPSIQGTLIAVGLASLASVPVGILTGIYLSEFAGVGRFPSTLRLINDVLTGMPSIVIGLLAFLTLVLALGTYSILAGAFALSIIMTPIIVRVTEESLKLIPLTVREAGHALGVPKWKVSMFVVLMAAKKGVLTGIVLGMARIAGETAPLIMTIGGTRLFFSGFTSSADALPFRIFQYARSPFDPANEAAWGGALILIVLVLIMSVALRLIVEGKSLGAKTQTL